MNLSSVNRAGLVFTAALQLSSELYWLKTGQNQYSFSGQTLQQQKKKEKTSLKDFPKTRSERTNMGEWWKRGADGESSGILQLRMWIRTGLRAGAQWGVEALSRVGAKQPKAAPGVHLLDRNKNNNKIRVLLVSPHLYVSVSQTHHLCQGLLPQIYSRSPNLLI